MSQDRSPSQLLLISQPRTACHLLERMLSKQSCIHTYLQHPFGSSGRYPRDWLLSEPFREIPDDLRQKHERQMHKGLKLWREKLEISHKEGKALYVHFHPIFTLRPEEIFNYLTSATHINTKIRNPLSMPSNLLLRPGTVPLLTIRNPRLQVPSIWRVFTRTIPGGATRTDTLASVTGRWTRILYDWYLANGLKPLVVDADDYMSSEAFVRYLCEVAGLDPAEAVVRWEKVDGRREMGRVERNYAEIQETLFTSQGPEARRAAKNVDLEAEEASWEAEFGRETAETLRWIVRTVDPDYEYLRERRLRLPGSKL